MQTPAQPVGHFWVATLSKDSPAYERKAFEVYREVPGSPSFEDALEPGKPYDVSTCWSEPLIHLLLKLHHLD